MRRCIVVLMLTLCMLSVLSLPACATKDAAVPETVSTSLPFTDVPADAWYAEAVRYCNEQGIMNGAAGTVFSPNASMTRPMLAGVLYRMAGSPVVTAGTSFTDAAEGAWYSDAISWASQAGILSGYGNGVFGVNDMVTREQIAAVLWRYDGSPAALEAEGFADVADISPWALPAVNWARVSDILNGKAGNRFDPKSAVTRGEAANILYHYLSRSQEELPTHSDPLLVLSVGGRDFTVQLEENASAQALMENLPFTGIMSELNGNEKYYPLPKNLPTNPERPETIQAGDLMLYGSDNLVLFYESFATSYSYTRLGRVVDPSGLAEAVGGGNVEVTFRVKAQKNVPSSTENHRTLVAYFSATGTTQRLAEYAADILNADLCEIVPEVPYTPDDLDYGSALSRTTKEQNDPNARPAISKNVENMEDYDVVFLGYPIWHGQAPKIIRTFLESCRLEGKIIVPFCTSHSSGIGDSDTSLHALANGADWRSGMRFPGETSRDTMERWIESLTLA